MSAALGGRAAERDAAFEAAGFVRRQVAERRSVEEVDFPAMWNSPPDEPVPKEKDKASNPEGDLVAQDDRPWHWRVVSDMTNPDAPSKPMERPAWIDDTPPATREELEAQPTPGPVTKRAPLMRPGRFAAYLRRHLVQFVPGNEPDINRICRAWASGRALTRVPMQRVIRWPARVRVVLDHAPAQRLHHDDLWPLIEQTQHLLGERVEVHLSEGGPDDLWCPAAGVLTRLPVAASGVLLLGAMRAQNDPRRAKAWARWARDGARLGEPARMLTTGGHDVAQRLARAGVQVDVLSDATTRTGSVDTDKTMLSRWVACLHGNPCVTPEVLRTLRHALRQFEWPLELHHEAVLFEDPVFQHSGTSMTIRRDCRLEVQKRFQALPEKVRQVAVRVQLEALRRLSPLVRAEYVERIMLALVTGDPLRDQLAEEFQSLDKLYRGMAALMASDTSVNPELRNELTDYLRRYGRNNRELLTCVPAAMQTAWVFAEKGRLACEPDYWPASISISRFSWIFGDLIKTAPEVTQFLNADLIEFEYPADLQSLNVYDSATIAVAPNDQPLTWWPQLETLDANRLKGVLAEMGSEVSLAVAPNDQPLTWWPRLETLYANRLEGAPAELGSEHQYDNCLPRLKVWHRDLSAGVAPTADLKLFVLGNGRVGKTQICRRLKGEGFDVSVPSTHGISLGHIRLIEGDTEADPPEPAIDLRFWDFGGQDIYLGTHALFLDDRAVYVIAWTPSHENTDEFEENGVPMRNRPLRYWLEYVRSLVGPNAPVIVVQTQCDRERDVSSAPPIPADHGFERLRVADCSAKRGDGMARLMLELKSAARYQLERYGGVQLPANWVAVGDDLRRMRDEQGIRTLRRDEFERLCAEQHQTAVPGVVLEYLHRSGQVFWKRGVFGDQVVLDQAWALDGMYAVLHRDSALPLIRQQHGRFTPQLLAVLVWQNRTEEERKLFLSMMERCQTCFKIADDTYVAPALLPLETAVVRQIAGIWLSAKAQVEVKLNYVFLHEGVLRALLCGIGLRAGVPAVYWRYGVCFYDQETAGVVRIRSELPDPSGQGGGWISVETTGANAAALAREVVDSIEQINIGQKPEVKWMSGEPSATRRMPGDDNGQEPFANLTPGPVPGAADAPIPVYVSYAWEPASESFVDAVSQRLPADRFEFRRDKTYMRNGDWISNFMAEIGRADRVLVVLSDKYLRSPNCMRELLHLFQRSQGDRADLMGRIVAVIPPDLKIDRARDRMVYVRHWRDEYAALESIYQDLGVTAMGATDRAEWLAIQDFLHRVPDIMAWVADVLMPRGAAGLEVALERLQTHMPR